MQQPAHLVRMVKILALAHGTGGTGDSGGEAEGGWPYG